MKINNLKFTIILLFCFHVVLVKSDIISKNVVNELQWFDNDTTYHKKYIYDKFGRVVLENKAFNQNNVWVNTHQNEWFYQGDKCFSQFERIWKNNKWENVYSIEYEYENDILANQICKEYKDAKAIPTIKTSFEYIGTKLANKKTYKWNVNDWQITSEMVYHYGSNGKIDSLLTKSLKSGVMSDSYLSTNTYLPNGALETLVFQERNQNNTSWDNYSFTKWYYKSQSQNAYSQRTKLWSKDKSIWEYSQNADYYYDSNNRIATEVYNSWNQVFWENKLRYDYLHDISGNYISKIQYQHIYNAWRSTSTISYSEWNGVLSSKIESKYDFWGGNTGEYVSTQIPYIFNDELSIQLAKTINISYMQIMVSDTIFFEAAPTELNIQMYPNPSSGIYYFNPEIYNINIWSVSNLSGLKLKLKDNYDHSGVVDLSDLPKGIYIFNAQNSERSYTQKLIKQ